MLLTNTDVDAVTLDAAGTILQPAPSVGHVYSDVAGAYDVNVKPELIHQCFLNAWQAAMSPQATTAPFDQPDDTQFAWWRNLVKSAFNDAGVLHEFGTRFDAFYADLYERFASPDAWHIFPDVAPFLNRARQSHIPVAIVSNWDNRLQRLVATTPLASHIAFVLTSAEARSMKPCPQIFMQAAHRLGVPASRIFHIGDSPRDDIDGARAAGLQAVLIDRRDVFHEPDSIKSLFEFLPD